MTNSRDTKQATTQIARTCDDCHDCRRQSCEACEQAWVNRNVKK